MAGRLDRPLSPRPWLAAAIGDHRRQRVPDGGFPGPQAGILAIWGFEVIFTAIYLVGGAVIVALSARRKVPPLGVAAYGGMLLVAAWVSSNRELMIGTVIGPAGAVLVALGIFGSFRRLTGTSRDSE